MGFLYQRNEHFLPMVSPALWAFYPGGMVYAETSLEAQASALL